MEHQVFKNVWDAISDSPQEAENMKVRSAIMTAVRDHIKKSGLNQEKAAVFLGISQPRVSELMNGRIDLFSVDKLISLASKAGLTIRIDISEAA